MGPAPHETDHWEVQLRKGSLDLAVLASLWGGRLYGLEIINRLQRSVGLSIAEGTIYPLLARLEANGLVWSEWVPGFSARPRKYYTLSEAGRNRVGEMKNIWMRHMVSLAELMTPIENQP